MKITLVIQIFFLYAAVATAQQVHTGLPFLKLGVTAASLGMGETHSIHQQDQDAVLYNPSSLSFFRNNAIVLSHKNWIENTNTEFLGATLLGNILSYSVYLNSTSIKNIEIRTMPGASEGSFTAENFNLGFSTALKVSDNIGVGVTAKFLYEKIFIDEASGYGFDVGTLYKYDNTLSFGASMLNIGTMNKLKSESSKLPTTFRFSGSYSYKEIESFPAIANAEIVKTLQDKLIHIHLGTQISYQNIVSLRVGYMSGYEAKSFSTGFGVRYGIITFDYAFVPYSNSFETGHTFTLGFLL